MNRPLLWRQDRSRSPPTFAEHRDPDADQHQCSNQVGAVGAGMRDVVVPLTKKIEINTNTPKTVQKVPMSKNGLNAGFGVADVFFSVNSFSCGLIDLMVVWKSQSIGLNR
jgi:hypothetical protein